MIYGLMSAVFHMSRDEINGLEWPAFLGYWKALPRAMELNAQYQAAELGKVLVEMFKRMR